MRFRQLGKPRVAIDIAPLVDVVFLLVIFFAVTTTFLETSGIKLELPTSSSTADREAREIAVFLAADGTLLFEGEELTLEQLQQRLPQALEGSETRVVVLRADSSTAHGEVVRVMDVVRASGAEGLTVATRFAGQ